MFQFTGIHVLGEFYGVSTEKLMQKDIAQQVQPWLAAAGATALETRIHFFDNGAYTLFTLLAESHLSIHTYPEHNAIFIDVFTCGNRTDPMCIVKELEAYYQPGRVSVKTVRRGEDTGIAPLGE